MNHTLYLECYGGISGDMTVAALLDLGADQQVLKQVLDSLPISGFSTKITYVNKSGLNVCDFNVILEQENHDHDMDYLHEPAASLQQAEEKHACSHEHGHAQEHHHTHEHRHSHGQEHCHSHSQEHRRLSDILSIIRQADMTDQAKKTASKIFTILGEAEALAHGTSLEDVHFHEAGAADSIIDIISAAVCLDNLNITDVIIPALYEGTGTIRCQHGILPVPVPATANIIQAHHIPLSLTGIQGEFVTPTGAAIAAAIRTSGQLPKQFEIIRTGLGAGKRTYERPSILRAMLVRASEPDSTLTKDVIYKLETNIDDCSGETMGYVFNCLMNAGARDVHYFPVYMKKNRPAYQLNILCSEEHITKLEQIIFSQTTTIGIRRQKMERTVLPREIRKLQTEYGEVQIKTCELDGQLRIYPEYDSVIQICKKTGLPYFEIYHKLQEICRQQLC